MFLFYVILKENLEYGKLLNKTKLQEYL